MVKINLLQAPKAVLFLFEPQYAGFAPVPVQERSGRAEKEGAGDPDPAPDCTRAREGARRRVVEEGSRQNQAPPDNRHNSREQIHEERPGQAPLPVRHHPTLVY